MARVAGTEETLMGALNPKFVVSEDAWKLCAVDAPETAEPFFCKNNVTLNGNFAPEAGAKPPLNVTL